MYLTFFVFIVITTFHCQVGFATTAIVFRTMSELAREHNFTPWNKALFKSDATPTIYPTIYLTHAH